MINRDYPRNIRGPGTPRTRAVIYSFELRSAQNNQSNRVSRKDFGKQEEAPARPPGVSYTEALAALRIHALDIRSTRL